MFLRYIYYEGVTKNDILYCTAPEETVKKIIAALLAVFSFIGVFALSMDFPAEAAKDYSIVRVKLTTSEVNGALSVTVAGNYSIEEFPSYVLTDKTYTIKNMSTGVAIYNGDYLIYSGSIITLKEHVQLGTSRNATKVKNSGTGSTYSYLGDMKFKLLDGSIAAINYVYIEEYLWGVLPFEMSNSWPIEALKAQAVLARTYAVGQMNNGATNYDLVDNTNDQVYRGYNSSYTRCFQAVTETAKQVGTYQGSVIRAWYSASNGGYTEVAAYRWTLSQPRAYEKVKADPYDLANPSSATEKIYIPKAIDESNPFPGMVNMKNELIMPQLVSAGNISADGSAITVTDDFTLKNIVSMERIYTSGHDVFASSGCKCEHISGLTVTVTVGTYEATIDEETQTEVITPVDKEVTFMLSATQHLNKWVGENGKTLFCNTSLVTTFLYEDIGDDGAVDGYIILRSRYGHGIGMSQRGAQQMANSGLTSADIISFYFEGASAQEYSLIADKKALTENPSTNGDHELCVNEVKLYERADLSSGVLAVIGEGANVFINEATDDFYKVTWNSLTGYIQKVEVTAVAANLQTGLAIPINGAVDVYAGASEAHSKLGDATSETLRVIASNYADGWHKVYFGNTVTFVKASDVVVTPAKATAISAVNVSLLNVRDGASSTGTNVIGALTQGTLLSVTKLNYNATYSQIIYNGTLRYVYTGNVTALPAAEKTLSAAAQLYADASDTTKLLDIPAATALSAYAASGDYTLVIYNGIAGYVRTDAFGSASEPTEPTDPTAPALPAVTAVARVNVGAMNIRNGASTSGTTVLGQLKLNALVAVVKTGYTSEWNEILVNDTVMYGYKAYLTDISASSKTTLTAAKLYKTASQDTFIQDIPSGTAMQTYATSGDYTCVLYNGVFGYIPTSAFKSEPAESEIPVAAAGTINATAVNIRAGMSTGTAKLATVEKGTKVDIIQLYAASTWHKILYNGKTAYVYATYLTIGGGVNKTLNALCDLKESPSASAQTLCTLASGAAVAVYNTSGGYTYVCSGTKAGYIPSSAVADEILPSADNGVLLTGVVNANGVNVRASTSGTSAILTSLNRNIVVHITKLYAGSNRHEIEYNGSKGYIYATYVTLQNGVAKTVSQATAARSTASASGTVLFTLTGGTSVTVFSASGDYIYVLSGTKAGYVLKDDLGIAEVPSTTANAYGEIVNVGSAVNVRAGASTSSALLGTLSKGATVEIIKQGTDWDTIIYKGVEAYVSAGFVSAYKSTYEATVSATATVLHGAASGTSSALKTLKKGDDLVVLYFGTLWTKVYASGSTGYVSTTDITKK